MSTAAVIAIAFAWGAIALAILRRNERAELQRDEPMPLSVALAIAAACAIVALYAPAPWKTTASIAAAGFGVASYGDARSRMLWDEIVIGTALLCAAAAAAGGRSTDALAGGALCGALFYLVYYAGILTRRETGFGDVKLAFGIGLALGPVAGVAAIALGSLAWIAAVGAWAVRRRMPYATLRATPFPFGPGLTAGLVFATFVLRYVPM